MKVAGKSQHKAVAPIIATLLMVAIAVVGGILIFVFTQGFFADEQVVGPTVDNIRIFGYDFSDTVEITGHTGTSVDCVTGGVAGGNLAAGDCFTIFIENLGDKPVAIQAIRVFGTTYTPDNGITGDDCTANNDTFSIVDASSAQVSIIEPNTQATICAEYGGNNVKPGRTIPIQVETANGQSSQINALNGALRGQQ